MVQHDPAVGEGDGGDDQPFLLDVTEPGFVIADGGVGGHGVRLTNCLLLQIQFTAQVGTFVEERLDTAFLQERCGLYLVVELKQPTFSAP